MQMVTRFSSGVANGWTVSPLESTVMRVAAMPFAVSASATACARLAESVLLMRGLPVCASA